MDVEFGYYPSPLSLSVGDIEIRTLPGLEETVALVGIEGVEADWVYAPPQEVSHLGSGGRYIRTMPYASRVFGLPKTHALRHAAADGDDHLAFLLWAFSLFTGMRLTATEAGFVDATPIVSGKLVDFGMSGASLGKAMALTDTFWRTHRAEPMRAKRFALASSLHPPPQRPTHADRIAWMCSLFGMPTPAWADKSGGRAEIAVLRNDTLHEALFMGEPLGFALHGVGTDSNLTLEMEALVCRLLIALLGASENDYVRTPVNTRQRHLLSW